MKRITTFQVQAKNGNYPTFLSNFYPCVVEYNSLMFPSVEHAYQASKTCDIDKQMEFTYGTPELAKKRGRKLKINWDFENNKIDIMYHLLQSKFSIAPLKNKLLETGNAELMEGNWWGDKFWGVDHKTLKGENHLGKLLMQIRNELNNS